MWLPSVPSRSANDTPHWSSHARFVKTTLLWQSLMNNAAGRTPMASPMGRSADKWPGSNEGFAIYEGALDVGVVNNWLAPQPNVITRFQPYLVTRTQFSKFSTRHPAESNLKITHRWQSLINALTSPLFPGSSTWGRGSELQVRRFVHLAVILNRKPVPIIWVLGATPTSCHQSVRYRPLPPRPCSTRKTWASLRP